MSQQINDNFQLLAGLPIDDRNKKLTIAERDAIASGRRFTGLKCFVEQTQTEYMLWGGITNADWIGVAGDNVSNGLETVIEGFYVLLAGKTTPLDWEIGDKFRGWIAGRYVVGRILALPVSLPSDIDNTTKVELAIDSDSGDETPDATTTVKGKLKLSGDLGGTADSPTVPGLLLKVNISSGVNTLSSSTKRYYALGDSITHGYGTTSGNTGYSDLINTQYPFLAYQKFAQLGATAMPTTGRPPLSDQVGFIPANATLITVMIGVNDFLVGNVIGNPDVVIAKTFASLNQTTNFCEAFRYNLETIKINFPNAKVRVITPLRVANSRTGTYRFQDYIDAEILIANFLGIPVIDAYNNSEIYYNSSFIPDGLHPNDAGQLMLKDIVLNGLIAPKQVKSTNDANVIHKTGDETKTGVLTLSPTVTATANNQTLVGANVDPTYVTGAFTGLNLMALSLSGGIVPKTTSVYGLGSATNYWSNVFSINAAINNISSNQVTLNVIKSGSASGINFLNSAGTIIKAKMFDNGHWSIQNGSTYTDDGYYLDVNGGVRFDSVKYRLAYTVATLPAGTRGDTTVITDALTPTYLGVAVGGGSVICMVFHNGTNWIT